MRFMASVDAEASMYVFTAPSFIWEDADFREQLKAYVMENFEEWEREKPRWWSEKLKSRIPSDMIPASARAAVVAGRKAAKEKKKKKGKKGTMKHLKESIVESIIDLAGEEPEPETLTAAYEGENDSDAGETNKN